MKNFNFQEVLEHQKLPIYPKQRYLIKMSLSDEFHQLKDMLPQKTL